MPNLGAIGNCGCYLRTGSDPATLRARLRGLLFCRGFIPRRAGTSEISLLALCFWHFANTSSPIWRGELERARLKVNGV